MSAYIPKYFNLLCVSYMYMYVYESTFFKTGVQSPLYCVEGEELVAQFGAH